MALGFALRKFASYLSNFRVCGGCFRSALRALFDKLPKLFSFFDVVVIHWLTSDMTINTCKVDHRKWAMRRELISQSYTTKLDQLWMVSAR